MFFFFANSVVYRCERKRFEREKKTIRSSATVGEKQFIITISPCRTGVIRSELWRVSTLWTPWAPVGQILGLKVSKNKLNNRLMLCKYSIMIMC